MGAMKRGRVAFAGALALVLVAVVAVALSSQGGSDSQGLREASATSGTPVVSCAAAVASEPRANPEGRVVLGAVLMPRRHIPGRPERERARRWPYWLKQGIQIRAGAPPVKIGVSRRWRRRVRIHWGDAPAASGVRFPSCPGTGWMWFVGGFHLERPSACVPLEVRVGDRRSRVLVGINRRCSAS